VFFKPATINMLAQFYTVSACVRVIELDLAGIGRYPALEDRTDQALCAAGC
jgi:hypothetical protein